MNVIKKQLDRNVLEIVMLLSKGIHRDTRADKTEILRLYEDIIGNLQGIQERCTIAEYQLFLKEYRSSIEVVQRMYNKYFYINNLN